MAGHTVPAPRAPAAGGVLPVPLCEQLCDRLAAAGGPQQAMQAIDAARLALLGPGLLTVNVDATGPGDAPGALLLQRAWTSDPAAYPVGGRKHKPMTPWTAQVLVRGEVFVGEGVDALRAAFDDAQRIEALGLRSVVNVPVLAQGRCRATFNLLRAAQAWGPGDVATIRLLALLATPSILAMAAALHAAPGPA